VRSRPRAHWVTPRERDAALEYLRRDPLENLLLMEMVASVGQPPSQSEPPAQVVAAWSGGEILGMASLRPSIVLDVRMTDEGLEACLPMLSALSTGLIKSPAAGVEPVWRALRMRGRRALIDRRETAYARRAGDAAPACEPGPGCSLRRADDTDLEELVEAARASLREEDRPDPFEGDPDGFRRWVRGRVSRARLVSEGGKPTFVSYADVRRSEGWLVQGVYTWPAERRRGHARAGMAGLLAEASAEGADHVQLAVVEGNVPALRLYEGLGFEPFCQLRTILFL
jgi:ribosomal protein S18 acetylase RimI-like enzyme